MCAAGKEAKYKVEDLSSESLGPLRKSDLKNGASLMAEYKGKSYPVLFEAFAGECVYPQIV